MGADMFGVDMILGMPWLDQADPVIRWHERKLFHVRPSEDVDGQACLYEVYDLETGEPVVERTQAPRRITSSSHPDIAVVDSQGIRRLCAAEGIQAFLLNIQDLDRTGTVIGSVTEVPTEIPYKYADYSDVFSKEKAHK